MDRVVEENRLQLRRHVLRVVLNSGHESVWHRGEADIVETRAHIQHMLLLLVEIVGLRHDLADPRGGLGLFAEEGIECREDTLAQLQRAAEVCFQRLMGQVDFFFACLKFLELALELEVCRREAFVQLLRCFFKGPVGLDELVTLHGVVQSGDHLSGYPRLRNKAENLTAIHR